MSIICQTRCDGSKLSPIVPPHCSRMRRQIRGVVGDVVAARPLVVAEEHRAVLDGDLARRGPGRSRRCPARPGAPPPSCASWCFEPSPPMNVLTSGDAHLLGGRDDVLEVADDLGPVRRVRMERVGVEAEAGDGQALRRDLGRTISVAWRGRQVGDVDVAGAGVAPGRRRPARGQQAISRTLEAVAGGPVGDLHQRRLGERGGQEAELHRARPPCSRGTGAGGRDVVAATSTQRPARALSATASPTSISSWPSAKVA